MTKQAASYFFIAFAMLISHFAYASTTIWMYKNDTIKLFIQVSDTVVAVLVDARKSKKDLDIDISDFVFATTDGEMHTACCSATQMLGGWMGPFDSITTEHGKKEVHILKRLPTSRSGSEFLVSTPLNGVTLKGYGDFHEISAKELHEEAK